MGAKLERFVPSGLAGERVEVDESLAPVVNRIRRYLPPEQVWEHFSSVPSETGGVRRFPYCRVDSSKLLCCSDWLAMARRARRAGSAEEERMYYEQASRFAMEVILWVEVGFEGLQNLASHPASRNWTSGGVEHFVNDRQRRKRIEKKGKKFYDSVMRDFVSYRNERGTEDDCISRIRLERFLNKWM